MAPELREEIDARNRRQRMRAQELRRHALLHQYVSRFAAEQKIERSREKLRRQVAHSRGLAQRAKLKAVRARERALR